jgi:hypothetical protein
MPTAQALPIPASMLPAGPLNPVDWIDMHTPKGIGGAMPSALMRGTPGAMAAYQRRQIPQIPTIAQGWPYFIQSRPYDRGAGAFAPQFGIIPVSPIGAGIYSPYKLPVIAGPGARYQLGAIWFDVQTIPTTLRMSPTMPIASVNALLATSTVSAMYATTG